MKRIVTAVLLMLALSVGCFCSNRYIVRTSAALQGKTDAVYSALQSSSFPEAHRAMADSYALWQQCRAPISALVRHNELDEIDRLYQRARQALDNTDQNESLLQLRELRAMLRLLPEMEKPTYANLL